MVVAKAVDRRGAKSRKKREWRIAGWRVRTIAGAALLLIIFATGFYLAQLYGEISAMIEQRREALSSAIYSAPAIIRPGDDVVRTGLIDRLSHLSYTQTDGACVTRRVLAHPGPDHDLHALLQPRGR